MSADLWTFASEEAQRDADLYSLSLARVASAGYWPVIARARDEDELDHAINLASEGITAMVASICSEPGEIPVLASRVMDSYRDDWRIVEAALVAQGVFTRQHFNAIAKALHDYQQRSGQQIPGLADHFASHLAGGNELFDPSRFKQAVNEGMAGSVAFDANNMTKEHFQTLANAIASAPIRHRAGLANHFADALSGSNPRFKRDVFMRAANPTSMQHGRGAARTAGAPAHGVDNSEAQAVVDWENAPYDERIAWQGQDDASAHTALITDAPSYGSGGPNDNFGFPAIQDDDEAEQVASEVASWEHADHQQRVDMGNGIGDADASSGPNRTDQGGFRTDPVGSDTSGEEPLLHSSSLDPELGLPEGYYRLDRYGAFIAIAMLPHAGDFSNADLALHMQQHHPEINARYASESDRGGLESLHDMGHAMGSATHEHSPERTGVFASLHPPFYLREADGQYQVVDRLGGVLASRGDRDQARAEQTRLYTIRTAMKKGAPFAGYKDFADCVSQNSDKENPQAYCGSIKHKVEDKKTSSVHLAAVAKAKSLVDEMPAAAQPHAVAKAMLVRARQFGLNEEETDLVVNAAIERCIERQVSKRALKLKDLNDRPYEATCSNRDCGNHGAAFVRDDFFGHDDDDAECPECGSPLTMGHQGSRLGFTRESDASSYAGDPHEITVRYSTRCQGKNCDADINRGDRAFYYPKGKKVLCLGKNGCGEAAQKDFNSARQDEDFYNRTYSRTASDIHPTPDEQDAEIAEMEAALQQLRERRSQQRSFPESRSASVISRLWNRLTGRTAGEMYHTGPAPDDPEGRSYERADPEDEAAIQRRFDSRKPVVKHPSEPDTLIHDPGNFWDGPTHITKVGPGHYKWLNWTKHYREPGKTDADRMEHFDHRGREIDEQGNLKRPGRYHPETGDLLPYDEWSENKREGRRRVAAGDPTNPFDPASTANTFSPAQDANATQSGGGQNAMDPSNNPPNEIDNNPPTTAASSPPRTKPATNPNAPKQPQPSPMMMPAAMPMTSQPMMAARAKVAIAQKILGDNPRLSDDQALHLATKTIERYPHLVSEAYGPEDADEDDKNDLLGDHRNGEHDEHPHEGCPACYGPLKSMYSSRHVGYGGADYPAQDSVTNYSYANCPQCQHQGLDTRTGHCHFCGYVAMNAGGGGWDPIGGTTTIAPGQRDLRNPALASKAPDGVSQENWDRAGNDAGLGVGHIWTNTRCPAYRSLDPSDCTCNEGRR